MAEKAYGRRRRWPLVLGLFLAACLIAAAYLLNGLVINADRTVSPTGEYQVSYNRLTKVITLRQFSTGAVSYEGKCYDPVFLWSPDGKYLAKNISGPDGSRRAEIGDLEHSAVYNTPSKSTIQEMYAETRTQNQNPYECVEILKWLDDSRVMIHFSWPSDTEGENIMGWYVFDFTSYTIDEFDLAVTA